MAPWVFGEEPLPQTVEAAAELRRAVSALQAAEQPASVVDDLLEVLARLDDGAADQRPRVGPTTEGRVYLDHGRDVGAYNPCFPEYELAVDGPRATGSVTFPIAYEGPAGGVVARAPGPYRRRDVGGGEQAVQGAGEVRLFLGRQEAHQRRPFGRPSSRSAMMSRWISLVPA